MNYKIYILNYSYHSNKKYKFTLYFLDDQDFPNFMRRTGQRILLESIKENH